MKRTPRSGWLRFVPSWGRNSADSAAQRKVFESRADSFAETYAAIAELDATAYSTAYWRDINHNVARRFLPRPPINFLRDNLIVGTMVVTKGGAMLAEELAYLESRVERARLGELLHEDYVGRPRLVSAYRTSHNTVHHLYHLERYREATSTRLSELETILEWGGGYGNFAKLFRRIAGTRGTYIIVDTPLFSALQWLYLGSVIGPDSVQLLTGPGEQIRPQMVNLVPTGLVPTLGSLRADLFISTWALSETTAESQDHVLAHDWYGAQHLLLGYQDSSNAFEAAARVGELARARGASIHHLDLLPGNYYAFL